SKRTLFWDQQASVTAVTTLRGQTRSVWNAWDGAAACSSSDAQHSADLSASKARGPTGAQPRGRPGQGPYPYSLSEPAPLTLDTSGKNLTEQNSYSNIPHEGKHTPLYERSSPINRPRAAAPTTWIPPTSLALLHRHLPTTTRAAEGRQRPLPGVGGMQPSEELVVSDLPPTARSF
ncbi:putative uncharacterized protein C9orf129 homolog, partial [Trachypithecus francoisi]|uniref:putative uncharacterized protein C9orf129 homolog n=1 Tax=Trachypithecus francoisi TaxID=54180 RepID=UPI00141A91CA